MCRYGSLVLLFAAACATQADTPTTEVAIVEVTAPPASASVVYAERQPPPQTDEFRVGDRVSVEWKDSHYPARITDIVGPQRYRVHYDGYGSEWDEIVGLSRIRRYDGTDPPPRGPLPKR